MPLGPLGFDLGCGAGKGVLHLNCTFISTSASGQSHMGAVVLKIFKASASCGCGCLHERPFVLRRKRRVSTYRR